jgi:hypothetical protein
MVEPGLWRPSMDVLSNPLMIPIVGTVFGTAMIVAIVVTVYWFKARDRELQVHQEMQIREFEHQRRMKELELEIEKTRARPGTQV